MEAGIGSFYMYFFPFSKDFFKSFIVYILIPMYISF